MTRENKKRTSVKRSSSTFKPVKLDIHRKSPIRCPSSCRLTRLDLDKLGSNLDIEDVFRSLRLKYSNVDPCTLIGKMLPTGCIPIGWKVTETLGKGANGIVVGTRGSSGQLGALKITHPHDYTSQNSMKKEHKIGRKFYDMGIGVEILEYCSFIRKKKKINTLHMSRIDGTISSYLQRGILSQDKISELVDGIFNILDIMKRGKITHADFHLSNIGFVHPDKGVSSKLVVIDFGKTTTKKYIRGYDIIKILICTQKGYTSYSRSPGNTITPKPARIMENLQRFEQLVRDKAKDIYNIEFPSDLDGMLSVKDEMESVNYDYL